MASEKLFWDIPFGGDVTVPEDRSRFLRVHAASSSTSTSTSNVSSVGTAVILHGGYWKNKFGLDDAYGNAGVISLAPFFVQRGFSAVEVEYRRADHEGGGWPGTNEDCLEAMRLIAELRAAAESRTTSAEQPAAVASKLNIDDERCWQACAALRPDRLLLVGHSAGGCLALWSGHNCPGNAKVSAVLALAPVADLLKGHELRISDDGDAIERYMHCVPDASESSLQAYKEASPQCLLPVTFPLLVAWGDADKDVPPDLVKSYADAASAMSPELVKALAIPEADHFAIVDAGSSAWKEHIVPALAEVLVDEEMKAALLAA